MFLVYEIFLIYLVIGKTMAGEQNDCTKLNFFIKRHSNNGNECCSQEGINCDEEGYIIYLKL